MNQYISFLAQHWVLSSLLVVIVIAIAIFELKATAMGPKRISPQMLVQLINHEDAVVVDIRMKDIFKKSHVINSINVVAAELERKFDRLTQHKEKPIVIVDAVGQQSTTIANKLIKDGFGDIRILNGGIKAWQEAGLPLDKG
jgi:rhodanese-related sulfurtransferase